MKVRITLTEPLLATKPANPEIFRDFVASKAPDAEKRAEEEAALKTSMEIIQEAEESSKCIFFRTPDGDPYWEAYQIRGFFKEACGFLRRADGALSKKLKAYKQEITGLIAVKPLNPVVPGEKIIRWQPPENVTIKGVALPTCDRPCRADTPQGPRVSLKSSEQLPAGSTLEFRIYCLKKDLIPLLEEWLAYAEDFIGWGQWRSSGKGQFTVEYLEDGQWKRPEKTLLETLEEAKKDGAGEKPAD